MLFSERYGHKKVKMLKKDEMPGAMKNRILNLIYEHFYKEIVDDLFIDNSFGDSLALRFAKFVWTDFFTGNLFEVDTNKSRLIIAKISKSSMKLRWFEVYDYIEFILENLPDRTKTQYFKKDILNLFKKEKIPYTIINNRICSSKIDDIEEIKEIEKALKVSDKYKSVREHLIKALDKWADRKNPDYANSIKESISAVESLVQIQLGKTGTLGKLIDKLDVHPALKKGFSNLYGWTSSEKTGIRHAGYNEELKPEEPEARYMLVTCSAFVNYAIAKLDGGIE